MLGGGGLRALMLVCMQVARDIDHSHATCILPTLLQCVTCNCSALACLMGMAAI